MTSVVGLDLSITATGIAAGQGSGCGITSVVKTEAFRGDRRLATIVAAVQHAVEGAKLAVLEDLPVHAHAAGITGMVHGAVRLTLLRLRVPYATVPPATLKRYATGRGNASKTDMAVASFKRAQLEFLDDNQCDAWWLRAMGLDHLGQPVVVLPQAQRESLARVRWPRKLPHEELVTR